MARILALHKEPRGWREVVDEILRAGAPASCRDKRVLEQLLSLCDAQLNPYPAEGTSTAYLLDATARCVGLEGLYSKLAGLHIEVFFSATTNILSSPAIGAAEASLLLQRIMDILYAIVAAPASVAPGAPPLSPEAERHERSARSHFHASGGTESLVELSAHMGWGAGHGRGCGPVTGPRVGGGGGKFGLSYTLRCVLLLHTLLTVRPADTEAAAVAALCSGLLPLAR